MAAGYDGHILSFVEIVDLSYFERLVLRGEVRHGRTAETQVDRAFMGRSSYGCIPGLVVVARDQHHHARKGTHQGYVLHGLVCGAILAQGDSRVGGGNLDIGVAVGDLLAKLVIDPARHKFCKRADERHLAGDGKSCCNAYHVGFSYSAFNETLREFRGEGIHLDRALEVGRKCEDAAVAPSRFKKACTESAAGVLLSCIGVFLHTSSLLMFLRAERAPSRIPLRKEPCRAICVFLP